MVPAFQASGNFMGHVTWASARGARSSPGCHIAGLRPLAEDGVALDDVVQRQPEHCAGLALG
jgi:hypothetical protein